MELPATNVTNVDNYRTSYLGGASKHMMMNHTTSTGLESSGTGAGMMM